MLYREIIAVCSEIHTKHMNALCGQNVELLNVKSRGALRNDDIPTSSNRNCSLVHCQYLLQCQRSVLKPI
jgi:hypothetical protein